VNFNTAVYTHIHKYKQYGMVSLNSPSQNVSFPLIWLDFYK